LYAKRQQICYNIIDFEQFHQIVKTTGGGWPVESPVNFNNDEIVDFEDLAELTENRLESEI